MSIQVLESQPHAAACHFPEVSLFSVPGTWWVCQTKYHEEKRLHSELMDIGIKSYLPLVERNDYRWGRKSVVYRPLFPSYLFFAAISHDSIDERYAAIETRRTLSLRKISDRDRFVKEIESTRILLCGDHRLGEYKGIACGKPCRIIHGPFMGAEGITETSERNRRVIVRISFLGRQLSADVPEDFVELI